MIKNAKKMTLEEKIALERLNDPYYEDFLEFKKTYVPPPPLFRMRYKGGVCILGAYGYGPSFKRDKEKETTTVEDRELGPYLRKLYDEEYRAIDRERHFYEPIPDLEASRAAAFIEWLQERLPGLEAEYIGPKAECVREADGTLRIY